MFMSTAAAAAAVAATMMRSRGIRPQYTLARWCAGGVCECAVSQQERQVGEGTGWASSVRRATPSWIFGVVHSAALRLCSK